jgi:TolB-like protein/tetratricopeptide (TPR) repeat protein/predicted Ser/Thr protein kinase
MRLDPAKWERMRTVFGGALACAVADRAAYVDSACGSDLSLLADVRVLLQAHDDAAGFLESPFVASALTIVDDGRTREEPEGSLRHTVREGHTVSHYRLEERLGEGGMGVVYRARDLALGRLAAIKILPESFTPTLRRRLREEADACARLQHPAIATYYDSGEWDDTAFIAMEFVRGQTLRARLREGALAQDHAVSIAVCVLEALSHAHAAGILHRDIKPENIIVTGERAAKLLDFGLAKTLVAADVDSTRTHLTGQSIIGTIGYMSPEQIRNEPLDVRSDLFQVGAVLYEMLAGRPAFPGVTAAERLAAVLTQDPPALTGANVRAELSAVIARALARDRGRRYPSGAALLSDLFRISAGEWSADLPDTLAVLDFQNLAEGTEDDWIGSGMGESLGSTLGRTPGLTLVARANTQAAQAACRAPAAEDTAMNVGSALGCRWVLTGEYRRLGPALRLQARLMETSTGRDILSQPFDGTLEHIFDLQDRIVTAVCASLTMEASVRPAGRRTNASAYECYARGRRLVVTRERGAFDRAQQFFEDAVRLDGGYAHALAGLAQTAAMRYTFTSDAAVLETALEYARRGIAADPTLSDSYIWLGYAHHRLARYGDADAHFAEAEAAFERCRALNPREVFGFYFGTLGPRWVRDADRSIALMQQAVTIDPHHGLSWWALGTMHFAVLGYAEASACFERCARLTGLPDATTVRGVEGYWAECLRRMGRLDEARLKALAGLDDIERSDFIFRDSNRVVCLLALGRTAADQGDTSAASAAFHQAIGHVQGRPRTLAGGTLLVQALAGLARLNQDAEAYDEACRRDARRDEFDFSWLCMCDDTVTGVDLAAAARVLDRQADADRFLARARVTREQR